MRNIDIHSEIRSPDSDGAMKKVILNSDIQTIGTIILSGLNNHFRLIVNRTNMWS